MPRPRGYALILALLLGSALFFWALAATRLSGAQKSLGGADERQAIAAAAATAGLDAAAAELKSNPTWATGFDQVLLPHSGGSYSMTFDATRTDLPWSTNNSTGTSPVSGWSNRSVPGGLMHLVSVGSFQGLRSVQEALLAPASAPFGLGVMGHLTGGTLGKDVLVDAYDPRLGPYPDSRIANGTGIGTNSTSRGAISLGAGSVVQGRVRIGPGGTSAVVSGTGTYQGLLVPTTAYPIPVVAPPSSFGRDSLSLNGTRTLAPGAYRDLNTSANTTLVLSAGNYVFRRINANAGFEIVVDSGPVNLFFTQGATLGAGARLNTAGPPENLMLHGAGSGRSVSFSMGNGSTGQFDLIAPQCSFVLGTDCEVFGSVMSRVFNLGDRTRFHYDKSQEDVSTGLNIISRW